MHIAFLTPEYITESNFDGGLANYLYRVAQGMKERGHQIEIFTKSDKNEIIYNQNILIHRVKTKRFLLFKLLNRLTRRRLKKSIDILSLSYYLRRSLLRKHKKQPFDIIQASSYLSTGLMLTFNRPAPITTRISSYEPLMRKYYHKRFTLDQRFIEWLELLTLRRSNNVYAPSKLLSRILRKNTNIKVDVLPPPFFLETNNFDESIYQKHLFRKKYFIFFGTIGLLKGGEVLARSLPNILSQYPEMYFVFVGKDSSYKEHSMLKYILQQAGIYKNQIIYLGTLQHSQLYPIIKHSIAVVLPSLIDNLPNTMLEAMALGKIVIGTKGNSFEEVIDDGVSGILVEPNNSLKLGQAMKRVWNMNNEKREKIGKTAQQQIDFLSPEITCENLEQYFQKLIR